MKLQPPDRGLAPGLLGPAPLDFLLGREFLDVVPHFAAPISGDHVQESRVTEVEEGPPSHPRIHQEHAVQYLQLGDTLVASERDPAVLPESPDCIPREGRCGDPAVALAQNTDEEWAAFVDQLEAEVE